MSRGAGNSVFRQRQTAERARAASLALPGWAWQEGRRQQLWILGRQAKGGGYTLEEIEAAYRRVRSMVPPIANRRYVRVDPVLGAGLIRDNSLAINADPNAMVVPGRALTTLQFHVKLAGDPFSIQISSMFTADGQNCL